MLLFLFLCGHAVAQPDTALVQSKIDEARALFSANPKQSLALAFESSRLAAQAGNKRLQAFSFNTIGSAYNYIGDNDSAIAWHRQALAIQEPLGDELGMGRSLTNIGIAYTCQGLNDKAINCFMQAEQKFINIKFDTGLSKLYNSLGSLFYNIKDFSNSISYYKKGIAISEKLDDVALNYSLKINLANVYGTSNRPQEALALYAESYKAAKADSIFSDLIMICNNMCHQYLQIGNYEEAERYSREALNIIKTQPLEDYLKTNSFSNHAELLARKGYYQEAVVFADSALRMLKSSPEINKEIELKQQLGMFLYKNKNYDRAYEVLMSALIQKDTVYAKNLKEKLSEINTIHEVEKKESEIASLSEARKKQETINYLLAGVVVVSIAFLVVAVINYRRKKKDNDIIRLQKNDVSAKNLIIEAKQKEILDSITYARRIQEAILPPERYWREHLPESFVLYLPKDIVAGDFYWMERRGDLLLLAAADCTGHGVPGAMVSVVCSNALKQAVKEFGLTDPGHILDKARELVLETFARSGEEIRDGMDISLCCLDTRTLALQWAGANNPLWIVSRSAPDHLPVLSEIKADKQPIGKYSEEKPFTTHHIQLKPGEQVYLFTDGYADQFGGATEQDRARGGKKFKYKALKELLLLLADEAPAVQQAGLLTALRQWQGGLEQVDDVCIIGIRV